MGRHFRGHALELIAEIGVLLDRGQRAAEPRIARQLLAPFDVFEADAPTGYSGSVPFSAQSASCASSTACRVSLEISVSASAARLALSAASSASMM